MKEKGKTQRMRRVEERRGRKKKWKKKGEIGRRDEKGEGKDSKIQWVNHNMNGRELPAKLLTKNRSISVFSGCTISSPLGKKVV